MHCACISIGEPSEENPLQNFEYSKGRQYILSLSSHDGKHKALKKQTGLQKINSATFKGEFVFEPQKNKIPDSLATIGPNSKVIPGSASEHFEIPFIRSPTGQFDSMVRWIIQERPDQMPEDLISMYKSGNYKFLYLIME